LSPAFALVTEKLRMRIRSQMAFLIKLFKILVSLGNWYTSCLSPNCTYDFCSMVWNTNNYKLWLCTNRVQTRGMDGINEWKNWKKWWMSETDDEWNSGVKQMNWLRKWKEWPVNEGNWAHGHWEEWMMGDTREWV
jgi:hypothetical protein